MKEVVTLLEERSVIFQTIALVKAFNACVGSASGNVFLSIFKIVRFFHGVKRFFHGLNDK